MHFNPTAVECAAIAFTEKDDTSKKLSDLSISLNIRNIRALLKIKHHAPNLMLALNGHHLKVTDQALRTLVLFAWCFYCADADESIPPLSYIDNRTNSKTPKTINRKIR